MPPSPAMRCSPRRELRVDTHKRGRSLEGGIISTEKEDDLALFNEVQSRERDNFLLQSSDDFEELFSTKLKYFSDYKLGISIPTRGEGSDLLNAEGEKNDYDWLLTPPATPLFPSLDDETEKPPVNLAQRGRPRSQPITISRSSTMEKSQRSSRGSASPNRLSPSPRSGDTAFQARGRPSSASWSSPTPCVRSATPSRRPSTPPNKQSTPAARSSTPTSRRMSTGSSGNMASSGARGTSPAKTSRGNSASPKIRAWQSNIPGFSLEAPPNLRTSLADRPASYIRGSSPASRNGRDSFSKSGRQSISPTASRSVSSSYSHERDRYSSHSKGSVASSGEDDVDSLQSIPVGSSHRSASRRIAALSNNRASTFSKKPTRTVSATSAPKRSFDLALRQMDHGKSPQNMFRPLLSSAPSSTFCAAKASAAQRVMMSRNSSVTTSSNASSDQGTSGAQDTEESDLNQVDVNSECIKVSHSDVREEVFAFDKADALGEDIAQETHVGSSSSQLVDSSEVPAVDSQAGGSENLSHLDSAVRPISANSGALDTKVDYLEKDDVNEINCLRCGRRYPAIDLNKEQLNLCPDCIKSDVNVSVAQPVTALEDYGNSSGVPTKASQGYELLDMSEHMITVSEHGDMIDEDGPRAGQCDEIFKEGKISLVEPLLITSTEDSRVQQLVGEHEQTQLVVGQPSVSSQVADDNARSQNMENFSECPNFKVDVLEGAGISVLLNRSSSAKGPVLQSRTLSATSIPYDDLSYVRGSLNSSRSSIGQGSASSSVDLGLARQVETRVQRQVSGKRSDLESHRYDVNTKHQHSGSFLSGTSGHTIQASGLLTCTFENNSESAVAHVERDDADLTCVATQGHLLASDDTGVDRPGTFVEGKQDFGSSIASIKEMSGLQLNINVGDCSVASVSYFEDSTSYENAEVLENNTRNVLDKASVPTPDSSSVKEDIVPDSVVDRMDIAEDPTHSFLDTISEIEIESNQPCSPGTLSDDTSLDSESNLGNSQELCVATVSDKDMTASVTESNTSELAHEESTVMIAGQGGSEARSLTLEEATDTILFCSSIVQNLAYEAATIGIEKENSAQLELARPIVTILGKENADRRDPQGRIASKRSSKSQKGRQRRVEMDVKPLSSNEENNEKPDVTTTCIVGAPIKAGSMKPPKLESKCNCTIM